MWACFHRLWHNTDHGHSLNSAFRIVSKTLEYACMFLLNCSDGQSLICKFFIFSEWCVVTLNTLLPILIQNIISYKCRMKYGNLNSSPHQLLRGFHHFSQDLHWTPTWSWARDDLWLGTWGPLPSLLLRSGAQELLLFQAVLWKSQFTSYE